MAMPLYRLVRESLVVNSGYLLGSLLIGAFSGTAFWAISTRFYAPDEFGYGSAILSMIQLLSSITSLGMGIAIVRFIAINPRPENLLNSILALISIITLVVCTVYLISIKIWSPKLTFLKHKLESILLLLIFVEALNLNSIFQMIFQAYRSSKYAFWQVVISNTLRLGLLPFFADNKVYGVVLAAAGGTIISTLISLVIFVPKVLPHYRISLSWSFPLFKTIIPYSSGSYVADLLYRAPVLLGPILVLELVGPDAGAYTYLSWMIGWVISSPGQALASAAFAEGAANPLKINYILLKAILYGGCSSVIIAVFSHLAAPWILMVFDQSYLSGALVILRWLILASPFMTLNIIFFIFLRVSNQIIKLILLSSLSAAIALAIPYLGLNRIGLSTIGIGWLFSQILVSTFAGKHLLSLIFHRGKTHQELKNIPREL